MLMLIERLDLETLSKAPKKSISTETLPQHRQANTHQVHKITYVI